MTYLRSIFTFLLALIMVCTLSVSAYASPNQIEHEAAENLARDFLTDLFVEDTASGEYVIDFTKYTSVEKFIEFMELHIQRINNQSARSNAADYDDRIFEANAIDFEDVDGGLLMLMHIKNFKHILTMDDDYTWSGSEYSVYVLVAEGKNGLEIRDFNYPHTSWEGIREKDYIPKDVNYWIDSPDIEAVLAYERESNMEIEAQYNEEHESENSDSVPNTSDESSPKTGKSFSDITILLPLFATMITVITKKHYQQ